MGEKIIVGPINNGLHSDRTAFVIDNDSFPTLLNAYQWRGRVKRKRGTQFLGRLTRIFNSASTAYIAAANSTLTLSLGAQNLITGFSLQTNSSIVPGTVTINDTTASKTYTDPAKNGILTASGGSGTINYATGAIVINSGASHVITAAFSYYPDLPVMGFEDYNIGNQTPINIAFDTTYAYSVSTITPPSVIYDVGFFKNPSANAFDSNPQKPVDTPLNWNGQDYQQFWTTNYEGAFWATNGVRTPFVITSNSMQFAGPSGSTTNNIITYTSNTATTLTLSITNCPLVEGDFIFANEWGASTAANEQTLNFQSGYVTTASPNTPAIATKTIVITFPNAAIATDTFAPGIIQYLTNNSITTKDCIRWYDGDPTTTNNGWVNFMPPLSEFAYSIAGTTPAQYYLVGAKSIISFKDRLLFFAPVIQTSTGSPIYLKDTCIYSLNGNPYYTASFQGSPLNPTTIIPILTPANNSSGLSVYGALPAAFFEDQTGFGGFQSAALDQEMTTFGPNEDVLIVGFNTIQTRFIYTGNDVSPFEFFLVNSELGSSSTFSSVIMDKGILTKGSRGYVITSQVDASRIDLDIPDQFFTTNLKSNGNQRICAIRNYENEWIYFTYPSDSINTIYPNTSMMWNYRDNTWSIHNECYTTYGLVRQITGYTWATIGLKYPTWGSWNVPWGTSNTNIGNPQIVGGNQQGFLMIKDVGTNEGNSLYIQGFSGNVVTSPNHCLNAGDYIIINNCLGTIGTLVNGLVFSVQNVTQNTFALSPNTITGSPTYLGNGTIVRCYIPQIMTKQFPVKWGDARKTRLGPQQYLFTKTANSQITLQIFLSQNSVTAYNDPAIVNDSLVYQQVLYTCPESTNLGLTPFNTNLQEINDMNTGSSLQQEMWHRMNTSLLGDTVQIGFTMNDAQMRALNPSGNPLNAFSEIELHGFILDVSPSGLLA